MKKTDCETKFEVLAEGKSRELIEVDTSLYIVNGITPEFGYINGFENIKHEDGRTLKGDRLTLFFKE